MKQRCWLPYLEKCKLGLQDLEYVLIARHAAEILSNPKLEKGKIFIGVFSKQYGFASQKFLVVRDYGLGFLWGGRHTYH